MDELLPPTTTTSVLTARSPDDLLAMVPVVLGFVPHDSLTMLTFGGRQFHARIDLPRGPGDVRAATDALLDPVRRGGIEMVALIYYTDDDGAARRSLRVLRRELRAAGVGVVEALRAHDGRWFPLLGDHPRPRGVAYDVSAHPFVAEAVLRGRIVLGSRDELAATLDPDPEAAAEVERALPLPPATPAWVRATLRRHVGARTRPTPAVAARLLAGLADRDCRDAAWHRMRRATGREEVELWTDLVRRCPESLVGDAAAVLAFACWVAGSGALAWCAIDRSLAADPEQSLASLVGDLLATATPPDEWEAMRSTRRPLRSA